MLLLWRFPKSCSTRLTNTSHTSIPGVVTRGEAQGSETSTVQQRGFWPRTEKRIQEDWANTRAKLSFTECHSTCVADTHKYTSHSHQYSAETNFVLEAKYISNWMVLILVAWPPGLQSAATHDLCQHENQLASLLNTWYPPQMYQCLDHIQLFLCLFSTATNHLPLYISTIPVIAYQTHHLSEIHLVVYRPPQHLVSQRKCHRQFPMHCWCRSRLCLLLFLPAYHHYLLPVSAHHEYSSHWELR